VETEGASRRTPKKIPQAVPSRSTLRRSVVPRSLSRAVMMARDIVCVRPGRFPANISVAPNSETARAQQRRAPLSTWGSGRGRATRAKTSHRVGPWEFRASWGPLGKVSVPHGLRGNVGRRGSGSDLSAERWARKYAGTRHPRYRAARRAAPQLTSRKRCPGLGRRARTLSLAHRLGRESGWTGPAASIEGDVFDNKRIEYRARILVPWR
jgi:hypothetical protein